MTSTSLDLAIFGFSIVSLALVYNLGRRYERAASRLTSRLTEDRAMNFLVYLTQILSEGEATKLLDELMKYYTRSRAAEAEMGNETVTAVLKRLESIIWELAQLLERATDIERGRSLEERVRSDSRISYLLAWLFTTQGSVLLASDFFSFPSTLHFAIIGTATLSWLLSVLFFIRSHSIVKRMRTEAMASRLG
jgi:thioredoxin-like negative regulator of GroEL